VWALGEKFHHLAAICLIDVIEEIAARLKIRRTIARLL
jgi:hypothetical protein